MATPRPWKITEIDTKGIKNGITREGGEPFIIATTHNYFESDNSYEAEANALLIVDAVNAYDALVKALRKALHNGKHEITCPSHNYLIAYQDDEDGLADCKCYRRAALELIKI